MRVAITREISAQIGCCELSYKARETIDVNLARAQHHQYVECLASLGCSVRRLREESGLPDAVFVEDTAVVLDELAILTRPGAESRRPEIQSIARALLPYRPLARIEAPATLDGGDVLRLGKRLFVGLSHRSNEAAVRQMQRLLHDYGYTVTGVQVEGCLHLKSAVTQVAEDTLLINSNWIRRDPFGPMRFIEVDPGEPCAANALMVDRRVIFPQAYCITRRHLEANGIEVVPVSASELAKAEGGVTCCSLLFITAGP
jgi:dimethylargininase